MLIAELVSDDFFVIYKFYLMPVVMPIKVNDVDTYDNTNYGWESVCAVFLKPEYEKKFKSGSVNFKIMYNNTPKEFIPDDSTDKFTLGDALSDFETTEGETKTFSLMDYRMIHNQTVGACFDGRIACRAFCGSTIKDGDKIIGIYYPEIMNMIQAEGHLYFK